MAVEMLGVIARQLEKVRIALTGIFIASPGGPEL
jgi:hypothetical protein